MTHPLTRARARLAVCVAIGLAVSAALAVFTPWQVTVLVGWDATALAFIGAVWFGIRDKDSGATAALATREDDSRAAADVILIAACVASLIGVAFALVRAAAETGAAHGLITAVAVVSVVLSWASVHAVFMLRYARLYYSGGGGIDFHTSERPDYGDFAYVGLTIGMTFQVSDTDLTAKPIRMAALRHALLSYLFGVVVVAMTINIVAGLLAK
jgi:uncharacterized membrane protein